MQGNRQNIFGGFWNAHPHYKFDLFQYKKTQLKKKQLEETAV